MLCQPKGQAAPLVREIDRRAAGAHRRPLTPLPAVPPDVIPEAEPVAERREPLALTGPDADQRRADDQRLRGRRIQGRDRREQPTRSGRKAVDMDPGRYGYPTELTGTDEFRVAVRPPESPPPDTGRAPPDDERPF